MKGHAFTLASALIVLAGAGIGDAIAVEPQPQMAQKQSVCQQLGKDYQDLYSFEAEDSLITICQKGQQYYYIETATSQNLRIQRSRYATTTIQAEEANNTMYANR